MAQKKLLTSGNIFRRTDNRWGGTIWYMDERGERRRKSFSGNTKIAVGKKITNYIAEFNKNMAENDETKKALRESMQNWLEVFKFPSVERTTYDRYECTANQIYPALGNIAVGEITASHLKNLLNIEMSEGYAYTTVKKTHNLLNEFFRYLTEQEIIQKNPMNSVLMLKKANFLAAQSREDLPNCEIITTFTAKEIEKFKAEAFRKHSNGKRKYRQSSAYVLMLNTGLRTGEILGLLNSDIDLENRVIHLQRGVKEISKREGIKPTQGRELKVGKLKTETSKRDVPLNQTAVNAILDLRSEAYFAENAPLIADENGNFTKSVNFRKRYYRILKAAGIEIKGLHSLRHTFATNLVNGIKRADGTIKSLTPDRLRIYLGIQHQKLLNCIMSKKYCKAEWDY